MSKNSALPAVKASSTPAPLTPAAYRERFDPAAAAQGFRCMRLATMPAADATRLPVEEPVCVYTRRAGGGRPRIYLSAGIHGDEPAGPAALLQLLEGRAFDHRATWFLAPLLNPVGLTRGSRENHQQIDLNRDYNRPRSREIQAHVHWLRHQPLFDLALCLHEDWEATGFYLYELASGRRASLSPALLAAATRSLPMEPATVIDGREVTSPGLIRPEVDLHLRDLGAEAIYLHTHHGTDVYTLETPSRAPFAERVAALVAAVTAAIAAVVAPPPPPASVARGAD